MRRRRKIVRRKPAYHVELAMRQVGHAAEKLRAKPTGERHEKSPAAYYELNRVWARLDRINRGLRGSK